MDYDICDMQFINLNSSTSTKKNSTFLSDVQFNFKSILHEQDNIDYVTVGILNAQLPVSFYTVNYTNNTLIFIYGGDTYTIAITRGNYNSNSLITELVNQFLLVGFAMTITTSRITGIMTFTSTSAIAFSFGGLSTIFSILGFVFSTTYNSVTNKIIAPYPLNLLGIKRLQINSSALSTNTYDSTTLGVSSNMASVPVNVASFGLIDYVNTSNSFPILTAKNVTYIDIQIVDENRNLVNFNGIDWTITIQLNIFRKATKYSNNLQDSLLKEIRDELKPIDNATIDNTTVDNTDPDVVTDNVPENSGSYNDPANYPTDPELELLINN